MQCQCESIKHFNDDQAGCPSEATETVATIHGDYKMCAPCARELPAEYRVSP